MNLLRNDKVLVGGHRMVVTANNYDDTTVELAPHGWDGQTPGERVPTSGVVPLEQMLAAEVFEFVAAFTPQQLVEVVHFMAGCAPYALVTYGQVFAPGLLPERLRPAVRDAGAELAAFEDVDGGETRG